MKEKNSSDTPEVRMKDLAVNQSREKTHAGIDVENSESKENSNETFIVRRNMHLQNIPRDSPLCPMKSNSSLAHHNEWSSLNSKFQPYDSQYEQNRSLANQRKSNDSQKNSKSYMLFQHQFMKEGQAFLCKVQKT